MNLGSVQPGDIIRAEGMHAYVIERLPGMLVVRGMVNNSTRRVKARDVEAIWLRRPRPRRNGR